jgi:hypothetical protein
VLLILLILVNSLPKKKKAVMKNLIKNHKPNQKKNKKRRNKLNVLKNKLFLFTKFSMSEPVVLEVLEEAVVVPLHPVNVEHPIVLPEIVLPETLPNLLVLNNHQVILGVIILEITGLPEEPIRQEVEGLEVEEEEVVEEEDMEEADIRCRMLLSSRIFP